MAQDVEALMRKRLLKPWSQEWKEARLRRLLKGLRFAEKIGDAKMCHIITKEIRRVLLKDSI